MNNKLSLSPITPEHTEKVTDIIAQTFYEKEPLGRHLQVPLSDIRLLVSDFIQQVASDGLCLVCLDEYDIPVGASLCRDLTTQVDFSRAPRSLDPVLSCLGNLFEQNFPYDLKSLKRGQGLEIFMTGVSSESRGKGVGHFLIRGASEYFANKGYQFSVTESTSPVTQSIRSQYDFRMIGNIDYKTYEYKGEKIFKDLSTHDYEASKKLFNSDNPGAALLIAYHNAA